MLDELKSRGLENVHLRLYEGLKENGQPEAWFMIVNNGEEPNLAEIAERGGPGTYNVSHTCPPEEDCPG